MDSILKKTGLILALFSQTFLTHSAFATGPGAAAKSSPGLEALNQAEREAYRMKKEGQNPRAKIQEAYQKSQTELGRDQKNAVQKSVKLTKSQKELIKKTIETKGANKGSKAPSETAANQAPAPKARARDQSKAPTTNMEAGAEGGATEVHFEK